MTKTEIKNNIQGNIGYLILNGNITRRQFNFLDAVLRARPNKYRDGGLYRFEAAFAIAEDWVDVEYQGEAVFITLTEKGETVLECNRDTYAI